MQQMCQQLQTGQFGHHIAQIGHACDLMPPTVACVGFDQKSKRPKQYHMRNLLPPKFALAAGVNHAVSTF